MAISRFQMNRQLRAYGGMMGQDGRRNYGIGSFFQEKIMDPWTPPFPITPTGELRPSKRITSEAHGSSGCSNHLVLSLNHSSAQTNENGRCSKSHHTENNNSEKP